LSVPGTRKNGPDPVADLLRKREVELEDLPGGIPNPDRFPPGLVGVLGQDLARYSEFSIALAGVTSLIPRGSKLYYTRSVDVSGNCNTVIRHAQEMEFEWVWIMGDDHSFEPGTLLKLLVHDVDLVVPHVLKRTPPWPPVVYSHQDEDGWYVAADLPLEGLTEIHAAGSAGMLVRKRVLDALEDPWFQPAPDAAGLNEDLYFCQKVREAGFKLYCDPAVRMGHIAVHTVWPGPTEDGWEIHLYHDENTILTMPSIVKAGREKIEAA
jgi:hypothetical protein